MDSYRRSRTHAACAPVSAQLRLQKAGSLANQQNNCGDIVRPPLPWTRAVCWAFIMVVLWLAVCLGHLIIQYNREGM